MKDSILFVGNDTKGRRAATQLLHLRGLHVLSAADAAAACDILSCEGAAVVVLDLTFSDTKGFEILRRLRGRFETRVLPAHPRVVVLADWAESAIERLAIGLGADAFLRKPVVAHQLLGAIAPFLGPAARTPEAPALRRPPADVSGGRVGVSSMDRSPLRPGSGQALRPGSAHEWSLGAAKYDRPLDAPAGARAMNA